MRYSVKTCPSDGRGSGGTLLRRHGNTDTNSCGKSDITSCGWGNGDVTSCGCGRCIVVDGGVSDIHRSPNSSHNFGRTGILWFRLDLWLWCGSLQRLAYRSRAVEGDVQHL